MRMTLSSRNVLAVLAVLAESCTGLTVVQRLPPPALWAGGGESG
jgi:hypothetical protein